MRRLMRWMGWFLAALLACGVLRVLAFDVMRVRPAIAHIENQLRAAAPSERQPPAALVDMLSRAYGGRINHLVADSALLTLSGQTDGTQESRNLSNRMGVALLLPLHLSKADVASAYLSTAYMGPGLYGFAAASQHYLGIPLERVDPEQAAKLVAISHAPHVYSQNPERLERRARHLMSLPASVG